MTLELRKADSIFQSYDLLSHTSGLFRNNNGRPLVRILYRCDLGKVCFVIKLISLYSFTDNFQHRALPWYHRRKPRTVSLNLQILHRASKNVDFKCFRLKNNKSTQQLRDSNAHGLR